MSRKKVVGKCHLCGIYGPLTFEHVPPEKAFNEKPTIKAQFDQVIGLGPDARIKGPIQQRGVGDYTLCGKCNNETGSWYGTPFIDWCYQGLEILIKSNGKPRLIYMNYLFPLKILKQIITMFASVNAPEFGDYYPELVKFVKNKDIMYLPPKYRFFVYYNIEGMLRYAGTSVYLKVNTHEITKISEFNFPPYGYVMTIDSNPPDPRLLEITHFSRYRYSDFDIKAMRFPVLPTHLLYPGDYRTKEEIIKKGEKSKKENES